LKLLSNSKKRQLIQIQSMFFPNFSENTYALGKIIFVTFIFRTSGL